MRSLLLFRFGSRVAAPCGLAALLAVAGAVGACGKNHDRLAAGPDTGGTSSGAAGGAGGATSSSHTGAQGGAGGSIVEPSGPTELTVVAGVVDSDAIRLCFVPYPATASSAVPWPADPAGLAYGHAARVDPLASVVPASGDVALYLLGGDLSAVGAASCDALIAGGSTGGLRVGLVGVLPASVFASEKSLLFVPAGCFGGIDHTSPVETSVCGAGYTPAFGTLNLLAGGMSRLTDAAHVSFQCAHASVATTGPNLELRLTPGIGNAGAMAVASTWAFGAIEPYPPFDKLTLAQLGTLTDAKLALVQVGQPAALAEATFPAALATSDVALADIQNGASLVFVALGPAPSLGAGPWWHAFAFTAVRAEPGP